MQGQTASDAAAAFDLLLAELDREVASVRQAGAEAFAAGDYAGAEERAERGRRIEELRASVATLRDEWHGLAADAGARAGRAVAGAAGRRRRSAGRAPRGSVTPERAYYRPILEALVELGGRGRVDEVLRVVYGKIGPKLQPVDRERLPVSRQLRWRNRARWARREMVEAGLLRGDASRGVWEITDAGRAWLRREQSRD